MSRWAFLVAAAALLATSDADPWLTVPTLVVLGAAAVVVPLLPSAVLSRPRFGWSLVFGDAVVVGIALLSGGRASPELGGLFFVSLLIAVLAAGTPGWTLAALAVPGLMVTLRVGDGGLVAMLDPGTLAAVTFLAFGSFYFMVSLRRVHAADAVLARARRESDELRALLEITETVTGTLDLRGVMTRIVRKVSDSVGAESCSVLIADPRSGSGSVVASSDRPEVDMLEVDLANYPELRRAIDTREPVIVQDVERDPIVSSVRDVLKAKGYRSIVVLPLIFGSEVLGTLFLRAGGNRPFGAERIRFCKVAAGACSNALKNALLYREIADEAERHRATSDKLRRLFDCSPDLILATDAAGRVTEGNGVALRMLASEREILDGCSLDHVLQTEGLTREPVGSDGILRRDVRLVGADGQSHEIELACAPLDDAIGGTGRVWVGRDVTHVRRVERSLAQVERLSSLGEIVAGVAHELNNPLSAVLGYSELLRRAVEREDHAHDLERVVEGARRCKRIVQNLLGFARKQTPEKRPLDLNASVRKVLELRAYHLRRSGISTELDLDTELPVASFDPYQIEQIVMNLITNAEQAMRERGGGTIRVRTASDGESVHLEVEDDGPGVPEALRGKIFDPFFTTKDVGKGTGLGLSLSFGMAREHGGHLELLDDAEERGARFRLSLPRASANAAEATDAGRVFPKSASDALSGRRILIAEDEPVVLDLLERVLSAEGVDVITARDGEEAWRALSEQSVDLVVTDVRMPRMDGQELYERVAEERPDLLRRIVFASGDVGCPETLAFLEGLPNRLLIKPLQVDTVRHVLSRALASSERVTR